MIKNVLDCNCRKILVAIYHILLTDKVWNPSNSISHKTSDKNRSKYTKNNFKQSLKQLLSLGLTTDEINNLINQNAILDS